MCFRDSQVNEVLHAMDGVDCSKGWGLIGRVSMEADLCDCPSCLVVSGHAHTLFQWHSSDKPWTGAHFAQSPFAGRKPLIDPDAGRDS